MDTFGRLDTLVNNAGILRDRMLVNMTESDWDDVVRVHLKGTFSPTHWAAVHWRQRAKTGEPTDARVVNTSSATGLYGNAGQINYGAAKAGIAAFTVIAALELGRYGVTVNAIAPMALTRMNADLPFGQELAGRRPRRFPAGARAHLPLGGLAGQRGGGRCHRADLQRARGLHQRRRGLAGRSERRQGGRWDPAELTGVIPDLVAGPVRPPTSPAPCPNSE